LKRKPTFSGRVALTSAAVASLVAASPPAAALGLGRLSVQSALGESLQAEIDVTSMTPEEASNLRIRVAPPESYRAANVDYNAVLPNTRATLQRRADGRQFVRLTSDRTVQEPFVDVILEISWATGRLVREYTLLFDPPIMARAQTPKPAAAPMAAAPAFTSPVLSAATPPAPPVPIAPAGPTREERRAAARQAEEARQAVAAARQPNAAETRVAARPPSSGAEEYEVKSGDSLSRIAAQHARAGVSLEQMLVALFRSNPQAFIDGNMNRLKAGVVLSVPSSDAAQAVDTAQARQVITAQSADFSAYRQRLAGMATNARPEGNARQASGKVEASVDDRKQAAAPTPDKLTLSKGTVAGASGDTPEDRLAKERERRATDARVAELAKNVDQLKKLSSGAAATTPSVAVAATTPAAPVPQAAPAPVPAAPTTAAPGPTAVPAPVVVAQAPVPATAPVVAPSPGPAAASAAAPAASAVAAVKPPARPVAKAAEEPHFLASMMEENPMALGAGGLVLALLAGFGIHRFAKRSKKDSGETSFLESRLQPDSFFGASGGQRIDTRDAAGNSSSMTYSLSQLDAIGDVDPVAEADVYLAYGRDLQAEEILKEAMRSSPERLAIRTKLLEVYAKRRDTKGFELLATQLFALTRGEGEEWAKAQEMGAEIDPENPLFQPGGTPALAAGVSAAEPLGVSTMVQSVVPVPSKPAESAPATESSFNEVDLDLDDPDIGTPTTSRGLLDTTEPFPAQVQADAEHLSAITQKMPLMPNEPQPDSREDALPFDMSDFSLDLDKPPVASAATPAVAASAASGDLALDEIDLPDLEDVDSNDPMLRKLELAEEFRQIGDRDGARDLLREVLAKASGATHSKAQGMLDDLG
jgi:pilus assembly protein FimV